MIRLLRSRLPWIIITIITLVLTLPTATHAVSTVTTSTEIQSLYRASARKTWFDGTRFWITLDDGTDIESWYSEDGTTWTLNSNATISNENYQYSIWGNESEAYLIRTEAQDIYAYKASSYPSTSFSWGSPTTVYNGGSAPGDGNNYFGSTITQDSNGYLWTTATGTPTGTTNTVYTKRSTSASSISAWDSANTLGFSNHINNRGTIVPLDNGDAYVVFTVNNDLFGCFYDDQTDNRWEDSDGNDCTSGANYDTISTNYGGGDDYSVAHDVVNYDVHLTYRDTTSNIIYYHRWDNSAGTNGAWQTANSLITSATGYGYTSISVDLSTSDPYIILADNNPNPDNPSYSYCDLSAASNSCDSASDWDSFTDLGDATNLAYTILNVAASNKIFGVWRSGSSSPYDIQAHVILDNESESEDPALTFSIDAVGANTVNNAITTSIASTFNSIPFNSLVIGTPKYAAHKLYASTNAASGYSTTLKMLNYMQGLYPGNNIDPFIANWSSATSWTEPTGTTPNDNTGWIGANTTDTRVANWNVAMDGKFGGISNSEVTVMSSPGSDNGTNVYVTYGVEVNAYQPADYYSGTIVYNITPIY